jgi:tetratricopeptide (TPR) repeat protein
MATEANSPGENPSEQRLASLRAKQAARRNKPEPVSSSKVLQIFLLIALLITGAAYVVDEWMEVKTDAILANHPNKLKRLVAGQNQFLTETSLGRQAEAKKQYNDAVAHYRRALIGQVNAEGRLNLGQALLKQGDPDMAFSQFKEALKLDPILETVYVAWGQALTLQAKTDEAAQLYQDALRRNSNFAQIHYNFALVLEQQEQTTQAAQHAGELANQPQAAAKSAAEAQLFGSDALKHYASAAQLGLNTPDFLCSYGTLLNKLGKFPQAEACLDKAVTQQPGLGAAQFQLALAQDRQGKYADAIGHYEATLVLIPNDPATLNNLALLYATSTNQEVRSSKMAVLLATRACDATTSQNARYMDTLARAYAADGDFFQAIDWEGKAVHRATQLVDHDLLRELQPRFTLFVQHKTE